jgi:hypothetical protein
MSALQLCEEALRVKDSAAARTRASALFEGIFSDDFSEPSKERAPPSPAETHEEDEIDSDPWAVIGSYGSAPSFSQRFLLGSATTMPLMQARPGRGEGQR